LKARWPLILVAALTALAFALRLDQFGSSLLGDEMSTLWIVSDNGPAGVIDLVSSDAEISPPLYFLFAWLSTQLGSAPELVRLPALVAGTACVPVIYVLGLRTVGRAAALIAAALMALSPFMVFFSGSGRAYTLMLLLLMASTLAMLAARRTGRTRWWFAYGLASALAMYTHYTALFVLLAQFIWLLWAFPAGRRPALLANAGAAALFLPWLPSFFSDSDSPTTALLENLQGDGFAVKRLAVEQWLFGHPLLPSAELPGRAVVVLIVAALAVAAVVALASIVRDGPGPAGWLDRNRTVVLVLALAIATPLGEALYGLTGTDLFGSRNLIASTPGMLLAFGGVLAAAGPVWGGVCGLAVIAGFTIGTAKGLEDAARTVDYRSAAAVIDARSEPGDVVVELVTPPVTPVPVTPLAAHLDSGTPPVALNLPAGEPPFLPLTPKPDPDRLLNEALAAAGDGSVFIVGPDATVTIGDSPRGEYVDGDIVLPPGWRIDARSSYPGVAGLSLYEVSRPGGP